MVSGNGENGYVTSGSPYTDSFIFQYMWFNFPSADPRVIPEELTGQLADARRNVFHLNDQWKVTFPDGTRRERTFFYGYHPGHQLRLSMKNKGTVSDYKDGPTMKRRKPACIIPMNGVSGSEPRLRPGKTMYRLRRSSNPLPAQRSICLSLSMTFRACIKRRANDRSNGAPIQKASGPECGLYRADCPLSFLSGQRAD